MDKENQYHEKVRNWIKANAPVKFHNFSLDDIPEDIFSESQLKEKNELLNEYYKEII